MLYAIQGHNIRMFLTPDEDKHLFANFNNLKVDQQAIQVTGDWYKGLTLEPLIDAQHFNNSFPILAINNKDDVIRTILIPLEYLKVSHNTKCSLNATGYIFCERSQNDSSLIAYPNLPMGSPEEAEKVGYLSFLDKLKTEYNLTFDKIEDQPDILEPIEEPIQSDTIEEKVVLSDPIDDTPESSDQPELDPIVEPDSSESAIWAKLLIDDINMWIGRNPGISVSVDSDGKVVKYSRKIKVRRVVV